MRWWCTSVFWRDAVGSRCREEFSEKPEIQDHWVNGGFFFFQGDSLSYLSKDEGCVLERERLVRLSRDGRSIGTVGSGTVWIRNATGSI
jgi:NDP-sugar pyrophosphorylase family protein